MGEFYDTEDGIDLIHEDFDVKEYMAAKYLQLLGNFSSQKSLIYKLLLGQSCSFCVAQLEQLNGVVYFMAAIQIIARIS